MKRMMVWTLVLLLLSTLLFAASANEEAQYDCVYPIEGGELYFDSQTGTVVGGTVSATLEIPAEIEGTPVVAIGLRAFAECRNVETLLLPEGLTQIGEMAFQYCTRLQKVSFPQSLERIEYEAFRGCAPLQEISLPEGLTHLGYGAFADCSNLKEVSIPESVQSFGVSMFARCSRLQSVSFPEGFTTIPEHTFSSCTKLSQVSLPDSLRCIEMNAFHGCKSLKQISLPEGLQYIGEKAFSSCALEDVQLPQSLCHLGYQAFNGYKGMTTKNHAVYLDGWIITALHEGDGHLVVEEGTVGVAERGLSCGKPWEVHPVYVTSVEIPASVRHLDALGFYDMEYHLKQVTVSEDNPYYTAKNNIIYSKDMTKLIYCATRYGESKLNVPNGVVEIGDYAFRFNFSVRTLVFPDSVERIGDYITQYSAVVRVEFGEGLQSVGTGAFMDRPLTQITLGNRVRSIGDLAFYNCGLVRVDMGRSVEHIGSYAFYDNPLLTQVDFPETLKTVGEGAFASCTSLHTALFRGAAPQLGPNAFTETDAALTLYYVDETDWDGITEYRTAKWTKPISKSFTDVKSDAWYFDEVEYAAEHELMYGVGENRFDPEGNMTRAMVVTVLWRIAGSIPSDCTSLVFTDVAKDTWYAQAVDWAYALEIVAGMSATQFDPDGNITREQLAAILYRYSKRLGLVEQTEAELTAFADGEKVSYYAIEPMQWAVSEGLIMGTQEPNGLYLAPQGNATRAQVAAILMRFMENIMK